MVGVVPCCVMSAARSSLRYSSSGELSLTVRLGLAGYKHLRATCRVHTSSCFVRHEVVLAMKHAWCRCMRQYTGCWCVRTSTWWAVSNSLHIANVRSLIHISSVYIDTCLQPGTTIQVNISRLYYCRKTSCSFVVCDSQDLQLLLLWLLIMLPIHVKARIRAVADFCFHTAKFIRDLHLGLASSGSGDPAWPVDWKLLLCLLLLPP